jgi:hypothetical protein
MAKKPKAHSEQTINPADGTVFFEEPADKAMLKMYAAMGIKTVVKKRSELLARKEILTVGGPTAGINEMLPELAGNSSVEHFLTGRDCTQQRWTCGDWAVRNVLSEEDLLAELKKGKHPLCVLEDQNIVIQANLEEYLTLQRKAAKARKPTPAYKKRQGYLPYEILPKLIKLSPSTKYVITCHMRGQGVSSEDRARYATIPQVANVIARLDSAEHKKYVLSLIRQLYA